MLERERATRFENSINLADLRNDGPQTEPNAERRVWTELTTPTIANFSLFQFEASSNSKVVRPKATQSFCLPQALP